MARGRSSGGNARNSHPRIKVGYTDLDSRTDGTCSAKLTAEVSGGYGDEQVQFFIDLTPVGTEISVDEFGHAQTLATGFSSMNHVVKAALVTDSGRIISATSRSIEVPREAKSTKVDKLIVAAGGSGGVYTIKVVVKSETSQLIKGVLVEIFDDSNGGSLLVSTATNEHGTIPHTKVVVKGDVGRYRVVAAGIVHELRFYGGSSVRCYLPLVASSIKDSRIERGSIWSPLINFWHGLCDAEAAVSKEEERIRTRNAYSAREN